MQKKITPIVENTANTLERKHEEYVVIPVRDPEELQNRYAKAHKSTGKELAVFMAILIVIVMGFFLAAKLL
ncbi:hypothetical protein CAEBREN_12667 [Caenorhabditis brenneri]|uniref:Uncharacterized protein n=1 Tax=Caenorhabditis brenneri TaxID=135651 RepID=G0MGP2_CAEBE|nr:hypothetical protein CAEBREN_12667 [Caenorhabditis brenneri]